MPAPPSTVTVLLDVPAALTNAGTKGSMVTPVAAVPVPRFFLRAVKGAEWPLGPCVQIQIEYSLDGGSRFANGPRIVYAGGPWRDDQGLIAVESNLSFSYKIGNKFVRMNTLRFTPTILQDINIGYRIEAPN